MSITTAQAVSLLENVLFESATTAQVNAAQWVELSQIDPSHSDVAGVAQAIASVEETGIAEQVVRYYEGALGRMPSGGEIAYYVGIAESGLSASQIALGTIGVPQPAWNQIAGYFAASPEFGQLYSGSQSGVIAALYQNILDRAPSAAETTYYQKVLDGGTSVSTLVQYFVSSPEYEAKANPQIASYLASNGVAATTAASNPVTLLPVSPGVSLVDGFQPDGSFWGEAGFQMVTAGSTFANGGGLTSVGSVTTVGGITLTAGTSTVTLGEGIDHVTLTGFSSAETVHFTAVPGSAAELAYTSGGTVYAVPVMAGATVDVPAGAGSIELTGIQSGTVFTLSHG